MRQSWVVCGVSSGRVHEGEWAVTCMHMHGMCGICMPMRTLIGRPQRSAERMETIAASAVVAPLTRAVEPLPSAAAAARRESPVGVGVGGQGVRGCLAAAIGSALRRRCRSLYACGDVVSGCTWARDGVNARLVQRGGVRVS